MKVRCIMSHEEPTTEGGFKRYEAGQEYDVEKIEPKFFEEITSGAPDKTKRRIEK